MNKEVILTALDTLTAGKTDDQTLELIESITNELNTVPDEGESEDNSAESLEALRAEYEAKLAACEDKWRNKYRTAFFHGAEPEENEDREDEEDEEEEEDEKTSYDDLFKKGNE